MQRACSALCDELSPSESHFQGLNLIRPEYVDAEMENDKGKKAKGAEEAERKGGSRGEGGGGAGFK